jgi:hypothetical protein
MTRYMLDGIVASNIQAAVSKYDAKLIAGYTDGRWPDFQAAHALMPELLAVSITVTPTQFGALVLDVENGDASPAQAPAWVVGSRARGIVPCIYCNASTWPAVRAAFTSARVAEPLYWIADYDNNPTIPDGAIAHQFLGTLSFDVSSVADMWPGLDPVTTATTLNVEEQEMTQIDSLTYHPQEYAFGVPADHGYSEVAFACDGYDQQGSLRVVTWDAAGDIVHEITVGGKDNTPAVHQTIVKFPNPDSTYLISVRRLDACNFPISVTFQ